MRGGDLLFRLGGSVCLGLRNHRLSLRAIFILALAPRLFLLVGRIACTLRSGEMDNLDFARVAKQQFGIEAIEFVNSFFKVKTIRFPET